MQNLKKKWKTNTFEAQKLCGLTVEKSLTKKLEWQP